MDWNFKAPSWDMGVVDETTLLPNIETTITDESTTRFGFYRTKGEFSIDLKLGGNSGSDCVVPKSKDVASSSPSGSYKRARNANNGALTVSCLVDGCNSDLSTCRDYHRRHKVCEQHSKTREVTIGGFKQRFCQQCSRFHSLEQFDEGKRSCRKRLDGHNRRRRKPQPEPVARPEGFLSNYQGTQFLPFSSSPHVYSSAAMVNPAWSNELVTSCSDARLHQIHSNQHQQQVHNNLFDKQVLFLGSNSSPASSYKEGNKQQQQLAFLHNANNAPTTLIFNNQTLMSDHMAVRTNNTKMFFDSLGPNPPRALSLLSSSSSTSSSSSSLTHTHGNGLSQMAHHQHHAMCLMQPLGLSLYERVMVPNGNGSDHCFSSSSVYDNNMGGSDGSQGNGDPHQLFPFQWD